MLLSYLYISAKPMNEAPNEMLLIRSSVNLFSALESSSITDTTLPPVMTGMMAQLL